MGEQEGGNRKTSNVDSVPLDESGLRELLVCHVVLCLQNKVNCVDSEIF